MTNRNSPFPTRTAIANKIAEKSALNPCEACGNPKWLVPHADQPDDGMMVSMLLGPGLGPTLRFTPAICTNCGHTRIFHVDTLMNDIS